MTQQFQNKFNQIHDNIRSLRSDPYFEVFDAFTRKWSSVLDIPEDLYPYLGADITVGIDVFVENVVSEKELFMLQNDFLQMICTPKLLLGDSESVSRKPLAEIVFMIKYLISLSGISPQSLMYQQWISLFQQHTIGMMRQMADQTRIGTIYNQYLERNEQSRMSVEDYFYSYAIEFGTTSSVGTSILLAIVLSPHLTRNLLIYLYSILNDIDVLYRLVSDLHLDEDEAINAQIYAYAKTQKRSILEARSELSQNDFVNYRMIQNHLYCYTLNYLSECEKNLMKKLDQANEESQSILKPLAQTLLNHAAQHLTVISDEIVD